MKLSFNDVNAWIGVFVGQYQMKLAKGFLVYDDMKLDIIMYI